MKQRPNRRERFRGIIIGTAVGDSLGLPAEGMSRNRIRKIFNGKWHHRLIPIFSKWRGMFSDDTEHTIFVGQSLLVCPNSPDCFTKRFSWCLRVWLLSLPAGIGWATLRAIILLWLGIPPSKSGVFSAGNGPAMRSALIGAFFASDPNQRCQYLEASTCVTHTDTRALAGAKAVAELAAWIIRENMIQKPSISDFIEMLEDISSQDTEWRELVHHISEALGQHESVTEFADRIGLPDGVTGYIYHTVPVALYAWYRHFGDFEKTLTAVLNCGGDTDTVGAIAGAIAGAVSGEQGIPEHWTDGIWEWPRGINVLRKIADRLESYDNLCDDSKEKSPVLYFWPGVVIRNLFFLFMVLLHGFRRLLPPY